jgi:hypothetical protein
MKEHKENISKYTDLTVTLRDLRKVNKVKIIPVIVSVKPRPDTYWKHIDRQLSSAQIKQYTILQRRIVKAISKIRLCVLCELKTLAWFSDDSFSLLVWDYVSVKLWPLTDPLSISQMIHEWIWSSGGMISRRKTEGLREKRVPVPLCPPQIPHAPPWERTLASSVRSRWLTAWAMARPSIDCYSNSCALKLNVFLKEHQNGKGRPVCPIICLTKRVNSSNMQH